MSYLEHVCECGHRQVNHLASVASYASVCGCCMDAGNARYSDEPELFPSWSTVNGAEEPLREPGTAFNGRTLCDCGRCVDRYAELVEP